MNFLERAKILTDRGVPVAPVLAGDKRCILKGWPELANTRQDILEMWAHFNPDANTAAVCRLDGIAVLDADSPEIANIVEPFITTPTFVVLSGGKGYPHFYFKHTDASRALGNCIICTEGAKRLADFQADRKYVVGPKSRLATTGKEYEIVNDAQIQPIPTPLVEWIHAHAIIEKPKPALEIREGSELSEEFDFEAFCKHFNITGHWKGSWFITDYCPVNGFPHNGSKHTGIYFDGNRLGFNCFAAGCPGTQMSFGQVLRHLNSTQAPYTGPIWRDDSERWLKNWRNTVAAV